MIASELFQFVPIGKTSKTREGGIIHDHKLIIGTGKFLVGELKFKAHRPYGIPKTITVTRHNGQWHVSFNYADTPVNGTQTHMSEDKLLEYFSGLTPEELDRITVGGDRGTVIPLATSSGLDYDFTETEKKRMAKSVKSRKKLQKKLCRQQLGSKRRNITKDKIGKTYTKQRNIWQDRAHKSSHAIVASDAQVFVFEDLLVKSMIKRAKPKKDERGGYVKNGAAAKSGLNKAILDSMWGTIVSFVRYKGLKKEKLTIKIPPPGTSQECFQCGHTHPDNRGTQQDFICGTCGFTANADYNASLVIKKRGIKALLDGTIKVKKKKFVRVRGKDQSSSETQIGQGLPQFKRASMTCSTMDGPESATGQETTLRRTAGNTLGTLVSVNREAPTSTVSCG